MSSIPSDVLTKFTDAQTSFWQTISPTVSEALSCEVTVGAIETSMTDASSVLGAHANNCIVVQFALSVLHDNPQVLIFQETAALTLAKALKGKAVEQLDDGVVSDLRGVFEGIVQGICMSTGSMTGETTTASGLTARYQAVSLPINLTGATDFVSVSIGVTGEDIACSGIWLLDSDTIHMMLGLRLVEDEDNPSGFAQPSSPFGIAGAAIDTHHGDGCALDLLLDIPLEISVELGRVKMLVKEVLELGTGSIIEIDKAAGEPVDVMVNGRPVARGEVVVIEDNFGVRITEILNTQERLTKLGDAA